MRKSLVAISALVVGVAVAVVATFYSPRANADTNLVEDPGFETSLSNFEPNQGGTSVNFTTNNPISGSRSLVVGTGGYGDSVLWNGKNLATFATKRSTQFSGSARIKATVASASSISLCGLVYYTNGQLVRDCQEVTGSIGDKGTVSVNFALNNNQDIDRVRIGIFQEGSAALSGVMVDDVSVVLAGVSASNPTPTPTPVSGSCGTANNTAVSAAPVANLCATGTAGSVAGSGPWSWTCNGSNGGASASCSAPVSQTPTPTPVNGVCGVANNTNVSSAPTSGLCSAGTAGSVAGSGPWSWSCSGTNGGTTASCSAQTVSAPVNFALTASKTGNGTITSNPAGINCGTTCSANFANNTSVTLTATAASGNTFSGWSGACSGTGTCTVSMTAARTVGATFATPPATATVRPLATANPRVLLSDSATLTRLQSALTANTAGAARFRTMVNNELASPGTNYAFQGWFAALMYRLTGETRYATFAINKIDAFVTAEEARISGGMRPVVAGDSFLEVGDYVGDVALVYDWANDRLTQSQKTRWINYMNTVLTNLWGNPDQVRWGGVNHPWSGWSLNDPFNNYYYSFLEATMFTGLATYGENPQAAQWLNKFYNEKIQAQLIPAFNSLPGGGSLEGTGYGTAQKRLFKLYFWWEKSTGVNIANQTPHTLGTMFWWANSMAPTLNKFVPTGDQSRDSTATFYDYHRELLENLMSLYPNEQVAGAIKTLLAQSNVPQMQHSVSFWSDFVNDWPAIPARPLSTLNTTYFGTGTGNLYTRSSWNTNAIFVHTIAGLYDQSHAHKDQGSFMLNVAGTWLFDDANLRSSSGIDGGEAYHNLVRIGSVSQREGSAPSQIVAMSDGSLFTYELMNTRPVYTDPYTNQFLVAKSEREMLFIKSGAVVLFDRAAANTAGTPRTFQLQMSGTPTISGNQLTFTAGGQRADVWRLSPANVPWTTAGVFSGTRAEAVHSSGTESLFLHIIGVNNKVTSAVADNTVTETGTRITFNDGTVATVRFSNAGRGGTLQIVNGSGVSQYNGALPTTVNSFPLYQ